MLAVSSTLSTCPLKHLKLLTRSALVEIAAGLMRLKQLGALAAWSGLLLRHRPGNMLLRPAGCLKLVHFDLTCKIGVVSKGPCTLRAPA
ncbi:hypothetical protein XA68_11978 [Ophiocordyceps unilateralis]|uniref:Uncharacterized protein n=1 Tax=Ophiocordyceps unilateralis TaxID=268505 RepID=A0A2A9PMN0_OPHUN|nr:hypothetical protein XA68_11978 [Ophiocordyceps unilateralis]